MSITLNTDYLKNFIDPKYLTALTEAVQGAHAALHNKTGKGNDFLGWIDLPSKVTDGFLNDLDALAKEVQSHSDVLISIGIGGSYLGIRSTIEFLGGNPKLPVYYAGHNIS